MTLRCEPASSSDEEEEEWSSASLVRAELVVDEAEAAPRRVRDDDEPRDGILVLVSAAEWPRAELMCARWGKVCWREDVVGHSPQPQPIIIIIRIRMMIV